MENQKPGIIHALEVLDSLKQNTVNADKVKVLFIYINIYL